MIWDLKNNLLSLENSEIICNMTIFKGKYKPMRTWKSTSDSNWLIYSYNQLMYSIVCYGILSQNMLEN